MKCDAHRPLVGHWFIKLVAIVLLPMLAACSQNQQNNSVIEQPSYASPLIEQRADPWIHRESDGTYYFIATSPKFDRIELREAQSIADLATAEAVEIWHKNPTGPFSLNIWAPELHKIDGQWYVYFAASSVEKPFNIRMHVLTTQSANPLEGEWKVAGTIDTGWDSFSLDATTFEHGGKRYLAWAQANKEGTYNSAVWLAEMTSPLTIDTSRVIALTEPTLPWEVIGYKVNEGPAAIIRNGKVFITYSASATDHNYAMGLVWADEESDLLDPNSWQKKQEPVFKTNPELKRFGPGHNGFTLAEDGKTDLMVYHARSYLDLQGNGLSDPNRHARVRVLNWYENGFPDFGQALAD